jgi:ABC-2 type transport system permease protein
MSARALAATTIRILRQLSHDPRTLALLIVVPTILMALLYYMFPAPPAGSPLPQIFDRVALIMLGLFPFIIMFVVTSVAMLRERTTGTLERLMVSPIGRLDLLFGYGIAFAIAAAIQATIVTGLAYWLFGLDTAGVPELVVLIAVANAVLGVALGLFFSAFARTEFQAVQFMPLVVFPQALLCGLFVPREQMADWLQSLSSAFPLTYAVEALQQVGANASATGTMWRDFGIVLGCVIVALALGAVTLRRRTP